MFAIFFTVNDNVYIHFLVDRANASVLAVGALTQLIMKTRQPCVEAIEKGLTIPM